MKKTAVQQVTFQGGMLEGIKQDTPFEQGGGALTSVLWLENYNHTLQQDSVIKRWGEVDSGVPLLDMGFYCPNEPYSHVINGGNILETERASWLQGVQMYSVVHPQYNDNITTFLKRYPNTSTGYSDDFIPDYIKNASVLHPVESSEAVAVVSYTIAKDGDSPTWQEVWADGVTEYAGWYTFGSLADVTRYGETLLFTTTLDDLPYFDSSLFAYPDYANPVNQYLYPVYRYLYWDITQKWKGENQFLNGITDYDPTNITNDKFHHWKVLPPAQYIVTNIDVGITAGMVQDTSTLTHGISPATATNDINIGIQECVMVGYKQDVPFNNSSQVIEAKYYPAWLDETYSEKVGYNQSRVLVPDFVLESLEDLDLPKMNLELYGIDYGNTVKVDSSFYGVSDARRENSLSVKILNNFYEIDTLQGLENPFTGVPGTDTVLIGTGLSKYTQSRSPRLWLYKEKLDLVLTANIGGVEVLMFRGTYEIQQKPMLPVGSPATIYGDDLPWVAPDIPSNIDAYVKNSSGSYDYNTLSYGYLLPNGRSLGTAGGLHSGFHTYHVYGSLLYFSIEVSSETMALLVDSSCSSLSLWCIKPDSDRHIVKSLGITVEDPSGNIYNKPLAQSNEVVDYTKYALLKKFVIDGRTDPPTDYENWIPSATLATNSWVQSTWTGGSSASDTYYVAVPINQVSGSTLIPNSSVPLYATDAAVIAYLDNVVSAVVNPLDTNYWTPDFVIWDYPTETTLFLNSSGKYWKGLGAKLITVIKGRTFIGGCIGADGIEEQAILRYSDVQGGAISPDIFSEERKIQVGHIPHTALLEFREQLWAFSRYQFYRIGMASITQEETWEFFDVVEQGTFNVKSAIVVPYGVVFCNEAGVWLSEGGEPQNLALPILPTYQHTTSGTQYLYTTINQLDGVPYIDDTNKNPYLEVSYDSFNDEILVYTPLFEEVTNDDNDADYKPVVDFTMIFSFKYKSWRIESSPVPEYELEIE